MTDELSKSTELGESPTSFEPLTESKTDIARDLVPVVEDAQALARSLGLDPHPVKYWIIDQDEMNELIAYDGFQTRYPHWRWGMKYEQQRKKSQYLGGKAFEIVNNDNPAHAFLQKSNTMADQKAVITHVEAHADFFKNNQWFSDNPDAAEMLAAHADKIESIIEDAEVSREEVEEWIDHVLCIENTINQSVDVDEALDAVGDHSKDVDKKIAELEEKIDSLGLREEIEEDRFDEEWMRDQVEDELPTTGAKDVLAFIQKHGKQYDEERERAVDMEDWQQQIIAMLRREAYYFAPQRMTKVMNEGWAAYWESVMMGNEAFADESEIIDYANHQSAVLNSPGFNPYSLGKKLWEYIENTTNRQEVVDKLLRVDGISSETFHDAVDFDHLYTLLHHPDSDDIVKRNFSLTRRPNRSFLQRISQDELKEMSRFVLDDARYDSIEEAVEDVDYEAGWRRMREIRESHNDITFIDAFLTQEFVDENNYFTYEYSLEIDQMRVSSKAADDVKKKLLLELVNFGKPTIRVKDGNYNNRNELLLEHDYNGVILDLDQTRDVLERLFKLWGRPVNLRTIVKHADEGEQGFLYRYDGEEHRRISVDWEEVEDLAADEVDYSTKPEGWT